MIWKVNGKVMKTPTTYKDNIEDLDSDSYTSIVDGSIIDNPIAVGMLKIDMEWDYLTEKEAEDLLQLTYKNPLIATFKSPSIKGGLLENAKFRVSQRTSEMHFTGNDEDTTKSCWKVSFSLTQKELTDEQKQAVEEANS